MPASVRLLNRFFPRDTLLISKLSPLGRVQATSFGQSQICKTFLVLSFVLALHAAVHSDFEVETEFVAPLVLKKKLHCYKRLVMVLGGNRAVAVRDDHSLHLARA